MTYEVLPVFTCAVCGKRKSGMGNWFVGVTPPAGWRHTGGRGGISICGVCDLTFTVYGRDKAIEKLGRANEQNAEGPSVQAGR